MCISDLVCGDNEDSCVSQRGSAANFTPKVELVIHTWAIWTDLDWASYDTTIVGPDVVAADAIFQ